jgi:DNA-binding MarR family transcriptional regulator
MGPLLSRDGCATVPRMTADDTKLRRLWSQVETFRELDPEMSSQTIATLLLVALNPGIRVLALGPKLGLERSAASRNVERLASITTKTGVRGWGLIEYRDDPEDRRAKCLYLTTKGEKFLQSVLQS